MSTSSRKIDVERHSGMGQPPVVHRRQDQFADEDCLVDLTVAKRLSGLCKTVIYQKMKAGTFPAAYKPGGRSTRWSLRELREWQQSLHRTC